jgi:hypothetical protein
VVEALNAVLKKDTTPGPVVPTCAHGPDALEPRSILKPASLNELSTQERLIWVCETVEAARPVGAIGIVSGVVALETFEYAEKFPPLYARTRKKYVVPSASPVAW